MKYAPDMNVLDVGGFPFTVAEADMRSAHEPSYRRRGWWAHTRYWLPESAIVGQLRPGIDHVNLRFAILNASVAGLVYAKDHADELDMERCGLGTPDDIAELIMGERLGIDAFRVYAFLRGLYFLYERHGRYSASIGELADLDKVTLGLAELLTVTRHDLRTEYRAMPGSLAIPVACGHCGGPITAETATLVEQRTRHWSPWDAENDGYSPWSDWAPAFPTHEGECPYPPAAAFLLNGVSLPKLPAMEARDV